MDMGFISLGYFFFRRVFVKKYTSPNWSPGRIPTSTHQQTNFKFRDPKKTHEMLAALPDDRIGCAGLVAYIGCSPVNLELVEDGPLPVINVYVWLHFLSFTKSQPVFFKRIF